MSIAEVEVETIRVRILPDGRMSREDAAQYLGLKSKTLSMWALRGMGPKPIRVGGRVFYYKEELDRFIAEGQPALAGVGARAPARHYVETDIMIVIDRAATGRPAGPLFLREANPAP